MKKDNTIKTERLVLRPWQEADLKPFAKLNADPRVMEYFPSIKSFEESLNEYQVILDHFKKHGYGWWAVTEKDKTHFIGFIGLRYLDFPADFTPAVEVAWRLAYEYWGKGYATEGAKASIGYGFEILGLEEIISFTSVPNLRSQAVMERIGMHHNSEDDFDHPKLPEGHWLKRHVLYRMNSKEWQGTNYVIT
jgi:3-dehydroquinate dehydratase/shikimate dehydrogenase